MTAPDPVMKAKAAFAVAVAHGIDSLMIKCGYDRERAIATLLRELSRGDLTQPSDEEIFGTMKRLGLGIEEATRTLVVGKAFRNIADSKSPEKAIEQLTAKIAVGNLMYDSSDEHDTTTKTESLIVRADLRVEPVSRSERQGVQRKTTMPVKKAKNFNKQRTRKVPCKSSAAGRKRSTDEMSSAAKKPESQAFQNRARADSVSEEVSAKIAKQSSEDSSNMTTETTARATNGASRTKRVHRTEQSDSFVPTPSKRIRGNEV